MVIKKLLILGLVLGGSGVMIGAFGAHGLENKISPDNIETFETGVRYQFYHAFLALITGMLTGLRPKIAGTLFILIFVGTVLFSGSIYGLATNELTGFDFKSIALLTPLGGLLLIAAWVVGIIGVLKLQVKPKA